MSAAAALAFAAAGCAVLAAWEAIAALDERRAGGALGRWLAPALAVLRAGREPTDPERRRLAALGALALLGGGWLVAGPWAAPACAAAGPWAARRAVERRRRRRAAALADGAPAIARALADALAGGSSVRGALLAAARDGGIPGAAGHELRAVAAELRLGARTEDALAGLARRPRRRPSEPPHPLETLAAAIVLQRDSGGDLAALLRETAAALEQRARALADARSATAQARFSAALVCALPAVALALGELARPGLLGALAGSAPSAALLVAALVLQAVALLAVRRIAAAGS